MQDNDKRLPPNILYKYRNVSEDNWRILRNEDFYFSDPIRDFNDPFDCQLPFDYSSTRSEVLNYFIGAATRQGHQILDMKAVEEKAEWIAENASNGTPDWEAEERELTEILLTIGHKNGQPKRIGVCSLSEIPDDILMFTHYADGHRGFCLGISITNNLEFFYNKQGRFLRHVDYVHEYKPPKFFAEHTDDKLIWKLFTKSAHWSYEKEWRIVDYIQGSGVKFLPKANICEVIIGCRMSDDDRKTIMRAVAWRRPELKIYEARKARNRVALELVEVSM